MGLLRFASESEDVGRDDVRMERDAGARPDVSELLVDDGIVAEIEPQAAIGFGDCRAQQPGRAAAIPEVAINHALLFPPVEIGRDFAVQEAAHLVTKKCMLFAEGEPTGHIEHR